MKGKVRFDEKTYERLYVKIQLANECCRDLLGESDRERESTAGPAWAMTSAQSDGGNRTDHEEFWRSPPRQRFLAIWSAPLKVPHRQPKRGRLWLNEGSCIRLRREDPDHVWSYDFVEDRTHNARTFRMLNVIDEFTGECIAKALGEWITAVSRQSLGKWLLRELQLEAP